MITQRTGIAVIRRGNEILLNRIGDSDLYFFPFGEVRESEEPLEALRRDFQEETRGVIKNATYIGIGERRFKYEEKLYNQLSTVYAVEVGGLIEAKTHGFTLDWLTIEEFQEKIVIPKHIAKAVRQWLKDGRTFWATFVGQKEED